MEDQVEDRALVAALVAGDQRGLDGAYRAYAERLHTYCRFLLHDHDAAADAVHDTFVVASQRAAQLRDPDRLRPWLYAIARNECLRTLRGRGRHVPLAEAGQVSAPEVDPDAGLRAEQVRELLWAAADGLNPGDRQVFELSVRHDLSAADVGAVLGVSTDHAHARLSRVRAHLERAIGALLVARTGARDCPPLDELLRGWDGRFTVLIRKRVSRHIESCPTCAERRREQVRPAALFSAYATLPMLAVPAELWPRLRLTCADPGHEATRWEIDQRAGRFDPGTGFPVPVAEGWRDPPAARIRRALVAAAVAAGVVALLLGGVALLPHLGGTPVETAARPGPATRVPVATPASGYPEAPPTPPPATTSADPGPPVPSSPPASSPTASPSAEPTGEPAVPSPLSVVAEGWVDCEDSGRYSLTVAATVEGGVVDSAILTWSTGSTRESAAPMRVTDATATRLIPRLAGAPLTWWVLVTGTDGRQARTEPSTNPRPCPVLR